MSNSLPKYAARLDALHYALEDDFVRIVSKVPITRHQTILDVGCGDGFFTSLLAQSAAYAVGLDTCQAYLEGARSITTRGNIEFCEGDARQLPFADASVDAIWSGHSMQSYPDIRECLTEFWRVLKPGGVLAVLETDNVHSVMLSWPPDLELAVRQAEHREIGDEDSYLGTYFPRFAAELFSDSGFNDFTPHYYFAHRHGPANEMLTEFVQLYLDNLLESTRDCLRMETQSRLAALADPASDQFLPQRKNFFFGSLQVLMLGHK
jgi:ubiquinone/menaquinone biosynthesis C-methylase UbiE